MKIKTYNLANSGFTMIVLLVATVLVILFSLYAYSRTMKRVEKNMKENFPETNIPAPTPQNYQQTLDSVKKNLNENAVKEQERLKDAQKELGE
jgi:Na+-transporting methylmalonyl-CoA/oxaloacetate decarboxylase gamma subunit